MLRRTLQFLLLFAIFAASAAAQTSGYEFPRYTPPENWRVDEDRDHITFTQIDAAARTYCMMGLYNSRSASGELQDEFAAEWKDVVQSSFTAGGPPATTEGSTKGGVRFLEGAADVRSANGKAYADLMVFAAGGRVTSLMIVASNRAALEARRAAIQTFVASLQFAAGKAAAAGKHAAEESSGAAAAHATGITGGKGIAGVWMGFKVFYGTNDLEPHPRWYTFFDNGEVFEDIPRTGLVGFDHAASQNDEHQRNYWGTYRYENGAGAITKPGVNFPTKLKADKPGDMLIDSIHFHRCVAVDHLRLEGGWTSLGDVHDSLLQRTPMGQRPVIRFTKDGRFSDEGIFQTILQSVSAERYLDGAGSGSYEVENFSLVLKYSDGRVRRVALTGLLGGDPALHNDIIFLGRTRFNKMN
ncbi:MAG: hypothetical protein LAN71_14150 [Acidobacteriia bacterium]|nr:hypothetical protein [Terriglobia bacterium]